MPKLRQTLHDMIAGACDETSSLTHAQVKELLKLGLMAIRQTKKAVTTPEELSSLWEPSLWEALSKKIASSDRFKTSPGLQTLSKQMAQTASSGNGFKNQKAGGPSKRKLDVIEETEAAESPVKAKRKKMKKSKA